MKHILGKRTNSKFTVVISLLIILSLSACSAISDMLEQSQNNPQAATAIAPPPTIEPTAIILPTLTFTPPPTIEPTATISPTQPDNNTPNSNETGDVSGGMQPGGMTVEEASNMPPLEPVHVGAALVGSSVEIQWQGTGLDIGLHYIVYRRIAGTDTWQMIATIAVEGDNRGSYSYQDSSIEANTSYEYALSIVDSFGNESRLSAIMTINSN